MTRDAIALAISLILLTAVLYALFCFLAWAVENGWFPWSPFCLPLPPCRIIANTKGGCLMDVLPDSRLQHNPTLGSVIGDFVLPDGKVIKLEWVRCYCVNCGADGGLVTKDNTAAFFYLCDPCFEKHGPPPGTTCLSDQAFRDKVAFELQQRFGDNVTLAELQQATERGELGRALELLERESPYKGG